MLVSSFHTFPAQTRSDEGAKASYKCSICSKTFKRSEHCARHQFAHNKERPFACHFCGKTYARKDLVKRHERTIHADQNSTSVVRVDKAGPVKDATGETEQSSSGAREVQRRALPEPTGPAVSNQDELEASDQIMVSTTALSKATYSSANREIQLKTSAASIAGSVPPAPLGRSYCSRSPNLLDPTRHINISSKRLRRRRDEACNNNNTDGSHGVMQLTSSQPIDVSDHHLDEIACSTDSISQPQAMNDPTQGRVATTPTSLWPNLNESRAQRHRSTSNSENVRRSTYELEQLNPAQTSPPTDLISPSDFFDLFDESLDAMGDDLMFDSVFNLPDNGVLNLQNGTTRHADFPIPSLHHRTSPPELPGQPVEDVVNEEHCWSPAEDIRQLPRVLKESATKPHRLEVTPQAFQALLDDTLNRLGQEDYEFPVKDRRQVQQFISGYVDCFHRHFPILHLPSLVVEKTPSPLIWVMCCIGALYRLDRRKARCIYRLTAQMLNSQLDEHGVPVPSQSPDSMREWPGDDEYTMKGCEMRPLWVMQTRVLLSLYASLGEDITIALAELERLGTFGKEYRLRRDYLSRNSEPLSGFSWKDWIEQESCKRLLCGMFIHSNLLVILYDIVPGFDITQDLDFEIPEEERYWNAGTADHWQSLRGAPTRPVKTIRTVLLHMLAGTSSGYSTQMQYYISGFTALVVIHAINIHVRHLSQVSHTLNKSMKTAGFASNILVSHTLTALTRCRDVLRSSRAETAELLWDDPEGPLLFNCEALLRVAYTRLITDVTMPQRFTLLCNSNEDRPEILRSFVAAKQDRSPLITKAATQILESFFIPVKVGYLLVRKTAAFDWSVEHAVSAWSCAIMLCQWVHSIEMEGSLSAPTEAEAHLIDQIKRALDDTDSDYDEGRSLAASVAKAWASLNNDVWVWNITERFGRVLSELAQVYELSYNAHHLG